MTARRQKPETNWSVLIVTSGLAAFISGYLSYAGVQATQVRERETQRCQLASEFLQDETVSPYLGDKARQRLAMLAARRIERCLVDR